MDERAARLAQADEEEFAFQNAKSANLAASATMCRWLRRAEETFGEEHDITNYYKEVLDTLKEQHERIWDGDKDAMVEAGKMAIEINKKYGGKREREISKDDHLTRFNNLNGPR